MHHCSRAQALDMGIHRAGLRRLMQNLPYITLPCTLYGRATRRATALYATTINVTESATYGTADHHLWSASLALEELLALLRYNSHRHRGFCPDRFSWGFW